MINIIVAVSKNGVIGNGGKIPWDIPEDMEHFKRLTSGNIVVMGRNTFDEIGRPLPNRFNIIVTSRKMPNYNNLICVSNFEQAIKKAGKMSGEIFICGGQRIYEQALPVADNLYITYIDKHYNGDRFFPECDKNDFLGELLKQDNQVYYYLFRRKTNGN